MSTYPPEFQALLDAGPLFDEQLGAVVRTSALLERQLSWLYGVLLQSPHGLLVAAGLPVSQILDLIDALVKAEETNKVLPPQLITDIKDLTQTVRQEVLQQRNSAVHGVWSLNAIDPNERWTRRVTRKTPFPTKPATWTVDSLKSLASRQQTLGQLCNTLVEEVAIQTGQVPTA